MIRTQPGKSGKREMLSRWLQTTGIGFLLAHLPQRNSLLVLNYHRLGDLETATYAPQVYSATPEEFEVQMEFVARHAHPVTLRQALSWIRGDAGQFAGCRTLITFDDGYLDNYQFARPILRKLGMQGVFFLPTSFIGTREIPWWDSIAWMVRNARNRRFRLEYPCPIEVDLEASELFNATYSVQNAFKLPEMTDPGRFMDEVERATGCARPEASGERCFMDWDEVRGMIRDGMAIGAHTHTHRLLGSLPGNEQREELAGCRRILLEKAGVEADTLAYPVGLQTSFTEETIRLTAEAGYRAAFSFYGGVNRSGDVNPYDIRREGIIYGQSLERLRTQRAVAAVTGRYWP